MKRALVPLLVSLLLLFSGLALLVASEPGTRLLFRAIQTLYPPLSIRRIDGTLLGSLRLEGVRYQSPEWKLRVSRALLRWRPRSLGQRRVWIRRLELTDPTLELKGKPTTREPAALPEIRLPLPLVVDRLSVDRLSIRRPGSDAVTIDRIELGLAVTGSRLQLRRATVAWAAFTFHGHGRLRMQDRYPLSLRFDWRYRPDFRGRGQIEGDLRRLTLDHRLTAPFTVTTSGTVSEIPQRPAFDLQGRWRQIHWPLDADPPWLARQGRYRLHGTPDDYRISLATTLAGPRMPSTRLQLEGQGNLQGFEHFDFRAEGQAGTLTGGGTLRWDPALNWRVALEGNHLDPTWWQAEFPGDLHLSARCEGRLAPDLRVSLDLERLQGRLRDRPLQARGRLTYRNRRLRSDRFDLSWGDNRLQLQGFAGRQRLDLSFRLHAPRLDVVAPGLAGDLKGRGRIRGAPAQPRIRLSLQGSRLRWGERVSLKRLNLEAHGQPRDPDSRLHLDLRLVQAGAWRFDRVRVDASGRFADHRLRLEARGPLGPVRLNATGRYRPGRTASWEGRIDRLPLTLLQPLLPGETSITGNIEARFSYRQEPGGRRGQLRWRLPKATLAATVEADRQVSLALADGRGQVVLENRRLQAELFLPFPHQGSVEAGLATDLGGRRLEGRARVDFTRLRLVEILIPQLQAVDGRLHGRLRLAGTWRRPVVGVDLRLTDAAARLVPAGIHVRQTSLRIHGENDKGFTVSGRLRSGPGQVAIRGRIRLRHGLSARLHLRGDRFEAVSLPRARILASPDLAMAIDDRVVRVTGKVHLPQADIRLRKTLFPEQTPEMVSVSDDEVILGRPPESKRRRLKLRSRIELTLGEKVHFQGYGLEARLQGRLSLATEDGLTTAEGVVRLLDGRFTAYGQKLKITLGRILFSGPVDDPAFDIHIVRHIERDNVTVTLKVSGFASDPRLDIASEPPLPEEDAIAYLVAGRPWSRMTEGEGNGARTAVAKALASLGVSYLNKMGLAKLARVEFQSSNLVIGKYLTTDLYVGYAVDIFTGIGEVLLRYTLTPRIHVEARSGASQSVDVFYTLETD